MIYTVPAFAKVVHGIRHEDITVAYEDYKHRSILLFYARGRFMDRLFQSSPLLMVEFDCLAHLVWLIPGFSFAGERKSCTGGSVTLTNRPPFFKFPAILKPARSGAYYVVKYRSASYCIVG